jgi:hypothetical protein
MPAVRCYTMPASAAEVPLDDSPQRPNSGASAAKAGFCHTSTAGLKGLLRPRIGRKEGHMAQATAQSDAKAWELFVELRKEIIESQKIRAQIIGFKITFVSSAVAVILANGARIPQQLLIVPAFAAVFFDFLIHSYSFSIKRIGRYCRENLEPVLFGASGFCPWEEFMSNPANRERYSMIGDLGITFLAAIPAIMALASPFRWNVSVPLFLVLLLLLAIDSRSFVTIGAYARKKKENEKKPETAMTARLPSD